MGIGEHQFISTPHADHHEHLQDSGLGASGGTGSLLLPSLPILIPSCMHRGCTSGLHQYPANSDPGSVHIGVVAHCREDKADPEYFGRRFRDHKNQHVQCRLGGHVPWALRLLDSLAVGGAWPKWGLIVVSWAGLRALLTS